MIHVRDGVENATAKKTTGTTHGAALTRVLVVDDERSMREFLQLLLERNGHQVQCAHNVQEALKQCGAGDPPDLVLTDLKLPDGTGMDVLTHVARTSPDTQVIVLTAFGTTQNAVEAMRLGAYDYVTKPVRVDEIEALTQKALEKRLLLRENRTLKEQLTERVGSMGRLLGTSAAMQKVRDLVARVAATKSNVLIEGESGTGKELVARAIHHASARSKGPFVPLNCGAIPETLIESELFGHVAGAFTGASKSREGLFDAAEGGTIFLDEIGELPALMQVKLLRVLQERVIRRVGDEKEHVIDVRVIAATNRDLQKRVAEGLFRDDLYYRLNVVQVHVPPLRERAEDIPLLARHFVVKYGQETNKHIEYISREAMHALQRYPFPGNVRELENSIERAVALMAGTVLGIEDLPDAVWGKRENGVGSGSKSGSGSGVVGETTRVASTPADGAGNVMLAEGLVLPDAGIDLEKHLEDLEKQWIALALTKAGGVKTHAAELLGMSFRSFRYRLQKLAMDAEDEHIEGG